MRERLGSALYGYSVAVGLTGAAIVLRWLLDPFLGDRLAYVSLFGAVAVTLWVGGSRPALFTAVLGYLACEFLFVQPRGGFDFSSFANLIGLFGYTVSMLIIIAFGAAMRRAEATAAQLRARQEESAIALRRSERELADFFDNANVGMHIVEADGIITRVNHAELEIVGYARDEYVGHHVRDFYEDKDVIDDIMTCLAKGESVQDQPARLRCKDGSIKHVRISSSVVIEDGEFVRTRCFMRDVTEQKHAEDALRGSEQRFRLMADAAPVMIWISGIDKRLTWFNRKWLDFVGNVMSRETGEGWTKNIHPDDYRRCMEIFSLSFDARQPFSREYRLKRRDGEFRWLLDTGVPTYAGDGEFSGYIGSCVDVTDLKANVEHFRTLADNISQLTWMARPDGYIFWYNRRWYEYTGTTMESQEGWGWQSAHDPDELPRVMKRWKHSIETGEPFEMVFPLRGADGEFRPFLTRVVPVRDEHGNVTRWFGTNTDITEPRRTERARQQFTTLAESSAEFVGICDVSLRPTYMNPAGLQMVGLSSLDEARRTPVLDFFYPEDRPFIEKEFLPRVQARGRGEVEIRFRHFRSGQPIWVIYSVVALIDEHGALTGYGTVTRDITDRKHTEAALRENEQRLRMAQLAGRTGVFEWMIPERTIVWASELEALYGLNEGAFEGTIEAWQSRIVPEDAVRMTREIRQCLRDRCTDYENEFRIVLPDGSRRWLRGQAQFVYAESGKPVRMIGVNVDIDARKRVEQVLRQTEEQFRTLAENMSQLAWMADDEGWIFWYNRRWYEYTGTTLEQVKGWGWTQMHHPEHVERVVERIQRSWDTGEPWDDTFPLRGKDNEYRWFLSRAMPIRDADGHVVRWFGTHTDVTDQLQAEDALRDANRRKDEFLATLAHELRNPLAPLRNMLEILKQSDNDPVLLHKARESMERQLSQMVRLVDDLMDVSRITRNKLSLRMGRVVLGEIVDQAIETCRPVIDRNKHELIVSIPTEPIILNGDSVRLAQVFGNLLDNACKYTPAGGNISMTVAVENGDACVRVKDNGVGIPERMLTNIFDMFTQVDRSLERSTGGLGIGLTLVQQLVRMHDGQIEASSAGPGLGSEFTVRLPILSDMPEEMPLRSQLGASSTPGMKRILVVDDNKDSADSLGLLLRLTGHDSHVAHDGLQAIDLAEQLRPGVIILDIGLPHLNGYDACRRIREAPWGREIVMIALTGWGQEEDRKRSRDAGFDYHVVKPVDHVELMRLLGSLYSESDNAPDAPSAQLTDHRTGT